MSYLRHDEEGTLSRLLVQLSLVLAASRQSTGANLLRETASQYNVNPDSIALMVKRDFATRDKAKTTMAPVKKEGTKKAA